MHDRINRNQNRQEIQQNTNRMSSLPAGWSQKESKSHHGKFYYFNSPTQETSLTVPTEAAPTRASEQVQVLHILRKHNESRRPASWRCDNITQSKETSIKEVTDIRDRLLKVQETEGLEAMHRLF